MSWKFESTTEKYSKLINNFEINNRVSLLRDRLTSSHGKTLVSKLCRLSDDSFLTIVKSSELMRVLTKNDSKSLVRLIQFLDKSILAEEMRQGKNCHISLWSASGDVFFNKGLRHIEQQNVINDKLLVDFRSPFALRKIYDSPSREKSFPAPSLYAENVELEIVEKLRQSYNLIYNNSTCCSTFLTDHVEAVSVQRLPIEYGYTSGSARPTLGRITLINADSKQVSTETLCSSLIHESIHNFLYKVELTRPFFLDFNVLDSIRLTSPWTGSPLRASTYIHACFINYSLIQFWKGVGTVRGRKEYKKCRVGFEEDRFLLPIRKIEKHMEKDILSSIYALRLSG